MNSATNNTVAGLQAAVLAVLVVAHVLATPAHDARQITAISLSVDRVDIDY
jgi:hypothetical protein